MQGTIRSKQMPGLNGPLKNIMAGARSDDYPDCIAEF